MPAGLWPTLQFPTTLAFESWPRWDERQRIETEAAKPVQINGEFHGNVKSPISADRWRNRAGGEFPRIRAC